MVTDLCSLPFLVLSLSFLFLSVPQTVVSFHCLSVCFHCPCAGFPIFVSPSFFMRTSPSGFIFPWSSAASPFFVLVVAIFDLRQRPLTSAAVYPHRRIRDEQVSISWTDPAAFSSQKAFFCCTHVICCHATPSFNASAASTNSACSRSKAASVSAVAASTCGRSAVAS